MTLAQTSSFSICIFLFIIFANKPVLWNEAAIPTVASNNAHATTKSVSDIPLPAGYKRLPQLAGTFGAWLRTMPLKQDNKVYLYNGQLKNNQQAQYAVLDISVGSKNLQQCADAVMRLYAEYLYAARSFGEISFNATDGTKMAYSDWMKGDRFVLKNNRLQKVRQAAPGSGQACFAQYLETVFSWAGTLSLSKELIPVKDTRKLLPGDVFIRGGAPGHAVIVMDVAENAVGERIFLLAQSYMPAQNIHVLKNPGAAGPWYAAGFSGKLFTPEWVFDANELTRFP
ncbi:DUF4846 domain-containing protein [Chitinophaga sp.]|uniref:DUF4846 domain-containing protein n=1 Tax=Chitinophaga sp. TaxID=1869181 RepID=UPI002F93372D